jgi:anti-sigma-K factor RskA
MEANALHDLTPAYALDALDPDDARAYEEHLARCERCRAELASLSEAAGALAYATEAPAPPAELRARILQQAQRERPNVVPLRSRWVAPLAAAAAVAACAAIALGIWAASLHGKLDRQQRLAAVLGDPAAQRNALTGDRGTLVVSANGDGVLIVKRLGPAPQGKTYEAWVSHGDAAPQRAGTFEGGPNHSVILLGRRVPQAAKVLVTVEKAGGSDTPTSEPFLTVQNRAQS